MKHTVPDLCPICDMPCNEYAVENICTLCDCDLASWRSNPLHDRVRQNLQELVDLVFEAREWGKTNGYPAARHYPQYPALRAIGERFHQLGREGRMARMLELLCAEVGRYDDAEWASASFVSFSWNGIGTWQP